MKGSRKGQVDAAQKPGSKKPRRFHYSFLKILSGSDLAYRRLPYMQALSEHPGPTVWLAACSHGDEVGGIVVVQETFRRLRKRRLLKGNVHAFPLMNPLGFEAASRKITLSEEDLNRAFPGNASGTLAERIADTIFQTIVGTAPEAVLDLHNDWIRSIPYTLLDPPADGVPTSTDLRATSLAAKTGFPCVTEPNTLRRTLSHSLLRQGIAALTIELGESYVVNETNVELGVRSIFNVLQSLDMVTPGEAPFAYPSPDEIQGKGLTYCQQPTSSTSGIIRFLVQPGAMVRGGQPVAKIVNAFGRHLETVAAQQDAMVLGLSDSSVAYPGAPIIAFAQI